MLTQRYIDDLTYEIVGCIIEVHKYLGPGLLESVYEKAFIRELELKGLTYKAQLTLPIEYKGIVLSGALRIDILIENIMLMELKAVEAILPVHEAQLLTYMKLMKIPKGILVNFNCANIVNEGKRTFVNEWYSSLPKS